MGPAWVLIVVSASAVLRATWKHSTCSTINCNVEYELVALLLRRYIEQHSPAQ